MSDARDFSPKDQDKGALFGYGDYIVLLLKEPYLGKDDNPINYGIYLLSPDSGRVCEAVASSFPYAMSLAIGLQRATEQFMAFADSDPGAVDVPSIGDKVH